MAWLYSLYVQLLNQMDGFDVLGRVKIIMATNRPDTLDPALLRPGRLDRKIEIGLPNEESRVDILKIHSEKLKHTDDVGMRMMMGRRWMRRRPILAVCSDDGANVM